MANLLDVVPQKKITKRKSKKSTELKRKIDEGTKDVFDFYDLTKKYLNSSESRESVSKMANVVNDNISQERSKFFQENNFLPLDCELQGFIMTKRSYYHDKDISIFEDSDFFTKVSQTPKSNLSDLKDIGERLNMSIIPSEYVDSVSYSKEDHKTVESIENFYRESERNGFTCYMLGPINFLDVWKCVNDKKELMQMWANEKHQNVLDAVSLSIPTFKNIISRIELIEENMDSCKNDTLKLQKQIDNVCDRVNALERKTLQLEAEQMKMKADFDRVEKQAAKNAQEIKTIWSARDPLLFAVPNGTDILFDDNVIAFLGPCYGPDFPDLMAELKSLKVNKKVGNTLINSVYKIW